MTSIPKPRVVYVATALDGYRNEVAPRADGGTRADWCAGGGQVCWAVCVEGRGGSKVHWALHVTAAFPGGSAYA